jgi:hypothetical protein
MADARGSVNLRGLMGEALAKPPVLQAEGSGFGVQVTFPA